MSRWSLVSLLVFLIAATAHAEVEAVFHPGGEPYRPAPVPRAELRGAPLPDNSLFLPLFQVDSTSASGLTTLLAVRNGSDDTVDTGISYFQPDGTFLFQDRFDLDGHTTRTINLRDVAGLPANPQSGLIEGIVGVFTFEGGSNTPGNGPSVIGGDYFLLDQPNDFASGGALLSTFGDACNRWDSRFFNGGGFDAGTNFVFLFNGTVVQGEPTATGNVYNEAGSFLGTVTVSSPRISFLVNSSAFVGLPAFGTIEWIFRDGSTGFVQTTFDASGRYSVGITPVCADPLTALPVASATAAPR